MEARTKAASAEYRGLLWGGGGQHWTSHRLPTPHPMGQPHSSGGDAEAGMGGQEQGSDAFGFLNIPGTALGA